MAKSTTFLDTNCLLRYVLGDNEAQATKVERLIAGGVQVDTAAFLEFVWVLESFYKMSRQQISDRIKVFTEDKRVNCDRNLLQRTDELYIRHPQISFLDAYLALAAERHGGRLQTFDSALAKKLPDQACLII